MNRNIALIANFIDDAGNFVTARARLHADLKNDAPVIRGDVELLSSAGGRVRAGIGRTAQIITRRADTAQAVRSSRAAP